MPRSLFSVQSPRLLYKSTQCSSQRKCIPIHAPSCTSRHTERLRKKSSPHLKGFRLHLRFLKRHHSPSPVDSGKQSEISEAVIHNQLQVLRHPPVFGNNAAAGRKCCFHSAQREEAAGRPPPGAHLAMVPGRGAVHLRGELSTSPPVSMVFK